MQGSHKARLVALTGAGVTAAVMAFAPSGLADQSAPTFNCRASALRVENTLPLPVPTVEPVIANGSATGTPDRVACADDDANVVPEVKQDLAVLAVDAVTPAAAARLTPDLGPARDQEAASGASIADATVSLLGGALTLKASALQAIADAKCVAGVPTLTGISSIGALSINGQKIGLDDPVTQIATLVNGTPLKGLVEILPNQELKGTNAAGQATFTRRALEVRVLSALGTPLATAVLGEAQVAADPAVCAAATPPETTTVTTPAPPAPPPSTTTVSTPAPPAPTGGGVAGASATSPKVILLNGKNGGCGKLTSLSFVRNHKTKLTSKLGTRQVVRGRLVSCSGKSIVGARLDVTHISNGKKLVKTGLRSRGQGRVTLILPLNLTTRKLVFAYRGNLNSTKVTSSRTLDLKVVDKSGRSVTKLTKAQKGL